LGNPFLAREKEGTTKTGFIANLIIVIIATFLYIPPVPIITSTLNISEYMIHEITNVMRMGCYQYSRGSFNS